MLIEKFEDAKVWQESQELAIIVYKAIKNCKDYDFKNQMQRAVISISNNIAEGFERQTNKELTHFLFISKGSCGEVRSMNYLALKFGFIGQTSFELIKSKSQVISRMLGSFIRSCK